MGGGVLQDEKDRLLNLTMRLLSMLIFVVVVVLGWRYSFNHPSLNSPLQASDVVAQSHELHILKSISPLYELQKDRLPDCPFIRIVMLSYSLNFFCSTLCAFTTSLQKWSNLRIDLWISLRVDRFPSD